MANFLAPAQLRIHVVHLDGSAQLLLDGELDLLTSPDFWRSASHVVDRLPLRSELVVNLGQLDFIDAAGLGVFVRLRNRLRSTGSVLRLQAASPQVRRVFELTQLDDMLGHARDRTVAAPIEETELQPRG